MNKLPDKEIIYKELSYKIIGILFDVVKALGASYQEKYYQRAIEENLLKQKIQYVREFPVEILVENKSIGRHFLDFLIDNKIILEIKKGNRFYLADIKQVLMYLKTTNLKLGILAYFGTNGVIYKRIVNASIKE